MDETETDIVDDTNKLMYMDPDADADTVNKADGVKQDEVMLKETTNTTSNTDSEEVCTGRCLLSMHINIRQSIADIVFSCPCLHQSIVGHGRDRNNYC